jgi:hypothetical protein
MEVHNIHERELEADPKQIGALLDSLASNKDRLWPILMWPRMSFDRLLILTLNAQHLSEYLTSDIRIFCRRPPRACVA